jgi:hypothetical protein
MLDVLLKSAFPLCALCAIYILVVWWLKFQKELRMTFSKALAISLANFVPSLVAMKLLAIIEVGGNLEKAPNMRLYGALFLLPLFYYFWARLTKRKLPLAMDVATVGMMIGLLVGRLNCVITGCCEGLPISFWPEIRWPIREIELIYCGIFVVLAARKVLKKRSRGLTLPTMWVSYGALRFAMEWVREEYTGSIGIFHMAHIWSLISMGVGAGIYIYISKTQKEVKNRVKARKK